MSHMKPMTVERIQEFREKHPGMGALEAQRKARQKNALDAIEEARWDIDPGRQIHTILDVLQYLVENRS